MRCRKHVCVRDRDRHCRCFTIPAGRITSATCCRCLPLLPAGVPAAHDGAINAEQGTTGNSLNVASNCILDIQSNLDIRNLDIRNALQPKNLNNPERFSYDPYKYVCPSKDLYNRDVSVTGTSSCDRDRSASRGSTVLK